jgi:hypothetical protein
MLRPPVPSGIGSEPGQVVPSPSVAGRRFLAMAGVVSAFTFALVLLAGVLPMLFLGPCDR